MAALSSKPWTNLGLLGLVMTIAWTIQSTFAEMRNNVIVIISDDLSAFYQSDTHPVKMPNVRSKLIQGGFARGGIEFLNMHTAFPVCGPSRMAFMTGRYADTTKLYTFERYVPQVSGLSTTAMYMNKQYGYETVSFGKVFHEDNKPHSPYILGMYEAGMWTSVPRQGGSDDGECNEQWFCSHPDEAKTGDYRLSRSFLQFLNQRNASKPLLAFLGIRKPHLQIGVPQVFSKRLLSGVDFIEPSEPSSLGRNNSILPFGQSLQRFECFYEIEQRKVLGMRAYPGSKLLTKANSFRLAAIRHYYFTAAEWVDSLIGYVVDYLNASPSYQNNTAVVFMSDHGFANGEHGTFCKNALFEQLTRVPFVVTPAKNHVAIASNQLNTQRTDAVDLINLFPTVVHLATGVELAPGSTVDTSGLPLSGRTVLRNQVYAFSQYPRCDLISRKSHWQCVIATTPCGRIANHWMGYMVKTNTTKYVEWREFNDVVTSCEVPNWPGLLPATRQKLMKVKQIDPVASGAVWNHTAVQREMFDDYPSGLGSFNWGHWEEANVLTSKLGNVTEVRKALELSAAIRWRFDPSFANATMPCSGNGIVRLKTPATWSDFSRDPQRQDVICECLKGYTGETCDTVSP